MTVLKRPKKEISNLKAPNKMENLLVTKSKSEQKQQNKKCYLYRSSNEIINIIMRVVGKFTLRIRNKRG